MIYSLCGTLIHTEPTFVVIECAGVGYKCMTTLNTQRVLPKIGERCTIYTHMLVRDDAIELCGFAGHEELNCFKLLMSISGVGARLALALLSELRPEQIAIAVSGGDSKTLTRANGVGKKLAERIILELKDKLKLISTTSASISSDFALLSEQINIIGISFPVELAASSLIPSNFSKINLSI